MVNCTAMEDGLAYLTDTFTQEILLMERKQALENMYGRQEPGKKVYGLMA